MPIETGEWQWQNATGNNDATITITPTMNPMPNRNTNLNPNRDWTNIRNNVTFFILGDVVGYTYSHWNDYEEIRTLDNGKRIKEILPPGKNALELQEYGALKLCTIFGKGMTIRGHVLTSKEAIKLIRSRTEFKRIKGRRDETSRLEV